MAGGIWKSQNKVRAGAYINFKAVNTNKMSAGDRGIMAIALPLSWGAEGEMIEVNSSDLLDGTSRKKVGFTAFDTLDDVNKNLIIPLTYCSKALVYRTTTGGAKATSTALGTNIDVTAKYSGMLGNKLAVSVAISGTTYTVVIYLDDVIVDTLKISSSESLYGYSNDYVTFTVTRGGSGTSDDPYTYPDLPTSAVSKTFFTNGTNGSKASTFDTDFLNALKKSKWQTVALLEDKPSTGEDTRGYANYVSAIKSMREDEGIYVQAVMADYDADYEGIINVNSGVYINDTKFTHGEFCSIVAGMTAGANIYESNTAKVITDATLLTDDYTNAEINTKLEEGKFILSTSSSGKIKVEKDINSLVTYGTEKNYNYSKNRVIRTLDEIGSTVKQTWEDSYMGKVDNNEDGRDLFKNDLIAYGRDLQRLNAIQEFEGADDITIAQGTDLDAVTVDWYVKPVDSMEKLYMNVYVNS